MTTLLARLAPQISRAIAGVMTLCDEHGWQPAVLACPCIMDGEPAVEDSEDGVFCEACSKDEPEDGDQPACRQCLLDLGFLGSAAA